MYMLLMHCRVGPLRWKVPYDSKDDAGNKAVTIYREVQVVEMSLQEYAASLSLQASAASETPSQQVLLETSLSNRCAMTDS